MDEFLALCVEYLEENKAAGINPQKPVMFVDRGDAVGMYHKGTLRQILEQALAKEMHTAVRAATFTKREDDAWVVALLPHFPLTGWEHRIYPTNSNGVLDLNDVFIPNDLIQEAVDALEK